MDFLDDEASPEEMQTALAQALRARMGQGKPQAADLYRGVGNFQLMGGGGMNERMAQAQLGQAQQLTAQAQQGKQFGLGQALAARKQQLEMAHQLQRDKLREAGDDRRARLSQGNGNQFIIVQGEDGGQYFVNPKNPAAPAIPVSDASGAPIKKPGKSALKELPAAMVEELAGNDAALKQLDALETETKQKARSAYSGAASWLPGTDAANFEDASKLNAKVIGRGIEGGRMTDADATQYQKLMPTVWDGDTRQDEKLRRLRESTHIKRAELLKAAEAAGFDVSRFPKGSGATPSPAAKPRRTVGNETRVWDGSKWVKE